MNKVIMKLSVATKLQTAEQAQYIVFNLTIPAAEFFEKTSEPSKHCDMVRIRMKKTTNYPLVVDHWAPNFYRELDC